jgi:iron complex transport system substrate-binding protein
MRWRLAVTIGSAACLLAGMAIGPRALAESSAQAEASEEHRTVIDDVGREVKMPRQVRRIVTLAPSLTETVYALGLGERLAGDTSECDNPPAARAKPHVGKPENPSLEAIVALHPDLVLAADSINRVDTVDALERLGITVYTAGGDTETVLGILDSIGKVAEVTGAKTEGDELVARLRQRLEALDRRLGDLPLVHVLFVVWLDPLQTVGQNTFIADALRWAGAESVVLSRQNWPQISIEEVLRLEPDYLVFAGGHGQSARSLLAELRSRPVWRDLGAVEAGHVVNLNEEAIRPAPGLVDAIEQLAREVHPEAFSLESELRTLALVRRASGIRECTECAR